MAFEDFIIKYQKKAVDAYRNNVSDNILVSVCVHTYQQKDYIRTCLDSILQQKTNFPYEILIGEDASSDGTREICMEYADRYPDKIRLFLHHRDNNIHYCDAPSGKFNFLYNLYQSRGQYIALCEGDDYWCDDQKLQTQFDILEQYKDVNITGHPSYFLRGTEIDQIKQLGYHGDQQKLIDYAQVINLHSYTAGFQSLFFRNKQIDEFSEIVLKLADAHGTIILYYSIENGFYYHPKVMSVYRIGSVGSIVQHVQGKKYYCWHFSQFALMDKLNKMTNYKYDKLFKKRKTIFAANILGRAKTNWQQKMVLIRQINLLDNPKLFFKIFLGLKYSKIKSFFK